MSWTMNPITPFNTVVAVVPVPSLVLQWNRQGATHGNTPCEGQGCSCIRLHRVAPSLSHHAIRMLVIAIASAWLLLMLIGRIGACSLASNPFRGLGKIGLYWETSTIPRTQAQVLRQFQVMLLNGLGWRCLGIHFVILDLENYSFLLGEGFVLRRPKDLCHCSPLKEWIAL